MSYSKKILSLIISSVILAILLYYFFAEIYLSKNTLFILLILVAIVADGLFFVRTFIKITSNYKDRN